MSFAIACALFDGFELSFHDSRLSSEFSRKCCRSAATCSCGWAETRCKKRCSSARRPSRNSASPPAGAAPLSFVVDVAITCFSGSGGTMVPGNFAANTPCSQSKSRNRRVTENWPNWYCGSEVFVVIS